MIFNTEVLRRDIRYGKLKLYILVSSIPNNILNSANSLFISVPPVLT